MAEPMGETGLETTRRNWDGAYREVFRGEQTRNGEALAALRMAGSAGFTTWNAVTSAVGLLDVPSAHHVLLGCHTAVATLIWLRARGKVGFSRRSFLAVPLLDMPVVFALQWVAMPGADEPRALAVFATSAMMLLVLFCGLALRVGLLVFGTVVAIVLECVLMIRAGESAYGMGAGMLMIGLSALLCGYAEQRRRGMAGEIAKEQVRRNLLARYFSPAVAAEIEAGLGDGEGVRAAEITVLFADLRGFSAWAENTDPVEVARMLDNHFEQMVEVVFRHDGTLDKYLGDGLMVSFGAPVERTDHARQAIRCALEMQEVLARGNACRVREGSAVFRMGIGIHTGRAVVGSLGASNRREWTAVGDTVNVAARLEQETKECRQLILASGETCHAAAGEAGFECLGEMAIKGRGKPVVVHVVAPPDKD